MQRESRKHQPHPAEAISEVVFEVCCRTLGALRIPFRLKPEPIETETDSEYHEEWAKLEKTSGLYLEGRELEHPIDHVEWDMLLGYMNRPNWNDRKNPELALRHQGELLRLARFHPQCLLPTAVRMAGEWVPSRLPNTRESPADAARPFPLDIVIDWLTAMNLIEERETGVRAKPECFSSIPRLRRTLLGLETIRAVADWVTGPFGPPARHLHFHLCDLNRKPAYAREIILIQGLSATPETHLALLHMLPHWSGGRRRILQDMILSRWIRSMEFFGHCPYFKARGAAGKVHRWRFICRNIDLIPRIELHPRGSSAGF